MRFFKNLNNKGNTSFLWVIVLLIIVYLMGFALDAINIIWIRHTAVNEAAIITRIAGKQGGFLSSKPEYWDKTTNFKYYTTGEITSLVRNSMDKTKATSWDVTLNGSSLTGGGNFTFDYKDDINIVMKVDYKWNYLSRMFPGNTNLHTYVYEDTVKSLLVIRTEDKLN